MKSKIKGIVLSLVLLGVLGCLFLLSSKAGSIKEYHVENLVIENDVIRFNLKTSNSIMLLRDCSVTVDRGVYTIEVQVGLCFGQIFPPEGIEVVKPITDEVKAIEIKDDKESKVIYPN